MKVFKKNLEIFSTARAIRKSEKTPNSLLADQVGIGDFLQHFTRRSRPNASAAMRRFCMHKASELARRKLKLSEDFLNFCKDSEYLFAFYEELSAEGVSIQTLKSRDTQSFFDEYLLTLEEVLKNYLSLLDERGVADAISEPKLLPNDYLLDQYGEIILYLDGFLKRAEIEFLSTLKTLKIRTDVSEYNRALMAKSFGVQLEAGFSYELTFVAQPADAAAADAAGAAQPGWQARKIAALKSPAKIYHAGFKSHMLEYLYAIFEAARQVREGEFAPEEIAVIVCDESRARSLKALDLGNYFNFAMGLKDLSYEQKLDALLAASGYELSREEVLKAALSLHSVRLDEASLLELASDARSKKSLAEQLAELAELAELAPIDFWQKLKLLKELSCSHVGGGSISVLGALESRGVAPKSVIVLDFNDDCVPVRAKAQMYLNNALRKRAGLISHEERENLQRHYYQLLFAQASRVVVLYVENESQLPARFLQKFEREKLQISSERLINAYSDFVLANKRAQPMNAQPLSGWQDDAKAYDMGKISYSKLSTLKRSGAEFYFKYVRGISEPRPLEPDDKLAGLSLHELLEKADFSASYEEFIVQFAPVLSGLSALERCIYKAALKQLHAFMAAQPYEPQRELEISAQIAGCEVFGIVDALLANGYVIDYKNSSSISSDSHAKQLAFYLLMLENGAKAANGEAVVIDAASDLMGVNVYLKAHSRAVINRKMLLKEREEVLKWLMLYKDDICAAKWDAKKAYGYYKLLATKEK